MILKEQKNPSHINVTQVDLFFIPWPLDHQPFHVIFGQSLLYAIFFFIDISDSGDSGYDEYEDDYAHIITENSARDKVEQVMTDFRPVDLPELLVITGRACTRILSGYEKNKIEEEKILSSLRTEGLLAKPGGKSKSGMSFEIVDMNSDLLNASFASTSSFLPSHKLR